MSNQESAAGPQGLTRRPSRSAAATTFSTEVFDNEVVPASLAASIAPILRVAKEIEHERSRVAYLCKPISFPTSAPHPFSHTHTQKDHFSSTFSENYEHILCKNNIFKKKMFFFFLGVEYKVECMRLRRHTGWIPALAGVVWGSSRRPFFKDWRG